MSDGFKKSKHVIEGDYVKGNQFPFALEPISARVVPIEDEYNVYCTTQWAKETQSSIAQTIDVLTNRLAPVNLSFTWLIDQTIILLFWFNNVNKWILNRINVNVRRLGGGFESKVSSPNLVACAAAVASQKLHRPVRITLDLNTQMTLFGWKDSYYSKYKVGILISRNFSKTCIIIIV